MKFENIHNQLQYIAAKGNDADIMNAITILYTYAKNYANGKSPVVKMIRKGKETAAANNLQLMMSGPTKDVNALADFNRARSNFFSYVSITNPDILTRVTDAGLLTRAGIFKGAPLGSYPVDVEDCQGNVLSSAANPTDYASDWNALKVPADLTLCGIYTQYIFETGFIQHFGLSNVQPTNFDENFNTPGINGMKRRKSFSANNKRVVDIETQVNPESISKFSDNNL